MADINYNLETLTGKHGGLLEVVETIVSDGRLIMIFTTVRQILGISDKSLEFLVCS